MKDIFNEYHDNIIDKKKYKLVNNENIYKKAIFSDAKVKYFVYLTKKYGLSNGIDIKKEKFNPSDFKDWLKTYVEMTKRYADFIESNDINLGSESLAELGKGKFDSIINNGAYEISEFSETMNRPKLVFGDVNRGLLIHENSQIYSLEDLGISTMITQNPNKITEMKDLIVLASEMDKNFVFGVYGNFSDKDIKMKTDMIKKLLESTDNNEFEYDTDRDSFYMLVRNFNKEKIKTLSR